MSKHDRMQPPPWPTFEYDLIEVNASVGKEEILAALNAAGEQGWEVIGVASAAGFDRFFMMRMKEDS